MQSIVLTIHILACVSLVGLVLIQSGKEGMGVIFGGGSQSFFGSTGAGSLLTKITAVCAGVFLCTSLAYNLLLKVELRGGSLMQGITSPAPEAPKPPVTFEEPAKPVADQPAPKPALETVAPQQPAEPAKPEPSVEQAKPEQPATQPKPEQPAEKAKPAPEAKPKKPAGK